MRNGDDPLGRLFGQASPDAFPDPAVEPVVGSRHDNGQVAPVSTPDPLAEPFSEPVAEHDNGHVAPVSTPDPDPPAHPSIEPVEEHHNGQVARTEPEPAGEEAPGPSRVAGPPLRGSLEPSPPLRGSLEPSPPLRGPLGPGARRLTRGVVRRIDPWSVLKLSVVFYVTLYCILLVAAVLLWTAANTTGLRDNVEGFIADLIASGQFHFVAGELLRAGAVGGAILVVLGTAANVMLAVLYNLISDMVGGLSVVVEERGVAGRRPTEPVPTADPEPAQLLIPEAELRRRPGPERGTGPERPSERGTGPRTSGRAEPSGL
ncbi:MAG: DUF3566 domain-containing protein [Acidimicrobiales bacterium]